MKKIVFLLNHFTYSDGVARALLEISNNLDQTKFDLTIIPLYRVEQKFAFELNGGIRLRKGFGFYFRGFDKVANLFPVKLLYRIIIRDRYDIEIAFQYGLSTRLVSNSLNRRALHIGWMHTYDSGLSLKSSYLKLDQIVCVSKCNAQRLNEELEGKVKIRYCYNILDDQKIFQKARYIPSLDCLVRPLLVSVGRIHPQKGYIRLVNILGDLKKEGLSFSLWIIGDGPERNKVQKKIDDLGLSKWITLVGSNDNPYSYVTRADLFVCSSFWEGYSTACTEAAILGIPILTTAVSGGQEIIQDAECGMIVDLDDNSLKNGLRTVLSSPKLLQEWRATAERTKKKFWLENRKKDMNQLFDRFIQDADEKGNNQ